MEDDEAKKVETSCFFQSCRGPFRYLSWGTNGSQKIKSGTKIQLLDQKKSLVIERYAYQSIRTDLD